jgi:hypothetical protein
MSVTLLSSKRRHAAHDRHRCQVCFRRIAKGELYEDSRCADNGTAWTFRAHLDCLDALYSWGPDEDECGYLTDYSDGHLPPCPLAWYVKGPVVVTCTCGHPVETQP